MGFPSPSPLSPLSPNLSPFSPPSSFVGTSLQRRHSTTVSHHRVRSGASHRRAAPFNTQRPHRAPPLVGSLSFPARSRRSPSRPVAVVFHAVVFVCSLVAAAAISPEAGVSTSPLPKTTSAAAGHC